MKESISLKSAERKAFQTVFADGLWDVLLGCFVLMFAIAPLLSKSMGDFWSSAVFLPFWGLVYMAIWLVRKHIVAPRIGMVNFSKTRKNKLRKFSLVMMIINLLIFILGVLATLSFGRTSGLAGTFPIVFGLFLLVGFSIAAHLLDYPRLYIYATLLFAAMPIGEWLYANHGIAHHGYPVVFGFSAGVMILTGFILFMRLLVNHPVVKTSPEGV